MSRKCARQLSVVLTLAMVAACENWEPPLTPKTNHLKLVGDIGWINPDGPEFEVTDGYSMRVAVVWTATKFSGDLRSAAAVWSAYRFGARIRVTVDAVPSVDGLLANSVVSTRSDAVLGRVAVGGSRTWYDPERTAMMAWHFRLIVMPWTTFDSSGDIKTYDAFKAAGSAGKLASVEGEGWGVAGFTHHMRTVKVTRKPK